MDDDIRWSPTAPTAFSRLNSVSTPPHRTRNDTLDVPKQCKKGSPYSITERRVPDLIPVLGSQPAGDVSHKPGGRLPLLSARPAVTSATLLPVLLLGEQRHDGCEQFA